MFVYNVLNIFAYEVIGAGREWGTIIVYSCLDDPLSLVTLALSCCFYIGVFSVDVSNNPFSYFVLFKLTQPWRANSHVNSIRQKLF